MGERYRVLKGLNYPGSGGTDIRREPGDFADDLPMVAIARLIEGGAIEPADLDELPASSEPTYVRKRDKRGEE